MLTISRKVTLPVVCGVWIITLLIAGYTSAMLPSFLDYYDHFQRQANNSIDYGTVTEMFHGYYLVGVPVGLCVIGYGAQLLRGAERSAAHVAWYAVLSMSMAMSWFVWTLLAQQTLYDLLFPA